MKILIVGFFTLISWSALSTYLYVCKIKGLCHETESTENVVVNQKTGVDYDTLEKSSVQAEIPKDLLIHFDFDKSVLRPDTKTEKYFTGSKVFLEMNHQAKLKITGHTDATGSDEYNQALGYRRAQSTLQYFENKGLSSDKIIIESKGETEPVSDNSTKSGRAENRRTSISIKK